MIPKIIHFTAPKEKEKWHPLWHDCFQSWKEHFDSSEFEIILWNHEEIDNFIEDNFTEEWKTYKNLPFHIMKLAFFRYCVLYTYGGIYSDMDMYCYKNFFETLKNDCYLVESWNSMNKEYVQNSLMCSSSKNVFFETCIHESILNFEKVNSKLSVKNIDHPKYNLFARATFGTLFLSSQFKKFIEEKNYTPTLLPKEIYNAHYYEYSENFVTKHMLTGMWGKEMLDSYTNEDFNKLYKINRHIDTDLNNFNYKKAYNFIID